MLGRPGTHNTMDRPLTPSAPTPPPAPPSPVRGFAWAERLKAAGIHLGLSLVVALLAAGLVFGLWYPMPFREISGGRELFLLIVAVDVVIGPVITLAVFDRRKRWRELRRDLADRSEELAALTARWEAEQLLAQQAQLVQLDERRAVVRVAGNWMAMVRSRLPLLQQALTKALGGERQLELEGGDGPVVPAAAPMAPAPARSPLPPPPAPPPLAPPSPAPAPPPAPASPSPPPPGPPSPPPAAAELQGQPVAGFERPAPGPPSQAIDERARRLAEFFNGEVIELDGSPDDDGVVTGDLLG